MTLDDRYCSYLYIEGYTKGHDEISKDMESYLKLFTREKYKYDNKYNKIHMPIHV